MSMAVTGRRLMMLGLYLAVQLSVGTSAAVSFSNGSLKGRYVYHLDPATSFGGSALGNPTGVATAGRQHVMRVGYIDFDGAGLIGNARAFAVTDDNTGQTIVVDFTWSGTYTVNPDGTGTLNVTAASATDAGCTPMQTMGFCTTLVGPETYAISLSKRFNSISLVQQDNAGGAKIFLQGEAIRQFRTTTPYFFTVGALRATYQFQLHPATSFDAIVDPAVATALRQDFLRVGYIKFGGLGTLLPSTTIATTDDNAGQTVVMNFQSIGSYTVNSDGTGTITLQPVVDDTSCTPAQVPSGTCATFQPSPQTFAFVLSKASQRMFLMSTKIAPGPKIFLLGEARVQ